MIDATQPGGLIVACGSISLYNDPSMPPGPRNLHLLYMRSLTIRGFRYRTYNDRFSDFLAEMGAWLRDGRLRHRETVVHGIERLPEAYASVFAQGHVGKLVVKVGPDDADDRRSSA
jgi:NADPH-dependent curcumin reductase CurA